MTTGGGAGRRAAHAHLASPFMDIVLWILAVLLVVGGVVSLVRKQWLWGAVLIIVGLLVGPGGVSLLT